MCNHQILNQLFEVLDQSGRRIGVLLAYCSDESVIGTAFYVMSHVKVCPQFRALCDNGSGVYDMMRFSVLNFSHIEKITSGHLCHCEAKMCFVLILSASQAVSKSQVEKLQLQYYNNLP